MLGVVSIFGGAYAFYDFGTRLLPLASHLIAGINDIVEIFTSPAKNAPRSLARG